MDEAQRRSAQAVSAALNAAIPDILAGINARNQRTKRPDVPFNDPGRDRAAEWEAEDGWLVSYSTHRVVGGKFDGKFLVTAHRPMGKGSRSGRGKAAYWELAYARPFATRKAAKARALQLYGQHSPRWAARRKRESSTEEP